MSQKKSPGAASRQKPSGASKKASPGPNHGKLAAQGMTKAQRVARATAGGKARRKAMSKAEWSEFSRRAVEKRWARYRRERKS